MSENPENQTNHSNPLSHHPQWYIMGNDNNQQLAERAGHTKKPLKIGETALCRSRRK